MILGPLSKTNIPPLTTFSWTIERVSSFKLLGVHVDSFFCVGQSTSTALLNNLLLDFTLSNSLKEQDYLAVICYTTVPQSYDQF